MALKALIFTGSYEIYLEFINEYHLKETECKYVRTVSDIQGYHKDTNPDLLIIFIDLYLDYLDNFWQPRAGNSDELEDLVSDFRGQAFNASGAEAAARLIQLTYITRPEQLPEYLTHEIEAVRVAALKKQEELQ